MDNKYYIYIFMCPETNAIRYIGKGRDRRAWHLSRRYGYCKSWIISLKKRNLKPIIKIIKDKLSEERAFELETFLIITCKKFGFKLTNLTNGGDGSSGHKHNQNAINIMSKTFFKKGHIPWNKGKSWNDETLQKISKNRKGIKAKLSENGKKRQLDALKNSCEKKKTYVVAIHKKTGEILEFSSQAEAVLKGFMQSQISHCCNNKFKKYSHKQYYWRFKNDING